MDNEQEVRDAWQSVESSIKTFKDGDTLLYDWTCKYDNDLSADRRSVVEGLFKDAYDYVDYWCKDVETTIDRIPILFTPNAIWAVKKHTDLLTELRDTFNESRVQLFMVIDWPSVVESYIDAEEQGVEMLPSTLNGLIAREERLLIEKGLSARVD